MPCKASRLRPPCLCPALPHIPVRFNSHGPWDVPLVMTVTIIIWSEGGATACTVGKRGGRSECGEWGAAWVPIGPAGLWLPAVSL